MEISILSTCSCLFLIDLANAFIYNQVSNGVHHSVFPSTYPKP